MIGWWLLWSSVATVLAWQTRQALREPLGRDRAIDEASRRWENPPPWAHAPIQVAPAPDNEPGINLAWQDECELILALTNDLDAGCDRLWDAIRDEQQRGGRDA